MQDIHIPYQPHSVALLLPDPVTVIIVVIESFHVSLIVVLPEVVLGTKGQENVELGTLIFI